MSLGESFLEDFERDGAAYISGFLANNLQVI